MANNKVEIDLDKLENEISSYDKIIEDANQVKENAIKERAIKEQIRDYIISHYKVSKREISKLPLFPTLDNFSKNTNQQGGVGQPTGISEFVRNYIKNNTGTHTSQIGIAYANYKKITLDANLKKMVSRALTRLKNGGDIRNVLKEGGKRAGSDWTYTKK